MRRLAARAVAARLIISLNWPLRLCLATAGEFLDLRDAKRTAPDGVAAHVLRFPGFIAPWPNRRRILRAAGEQICSGGIGKRPRRQLGAMFRRIAFGFFLAR